MVLSDWKNKLTSYGKCYNTADTDFKLVRRFACKTSRPANSGLTSVWCTHFMHSVEERTKTNDTFNKATERWQHISDRKTKTSIYPHDELGKSWHKCHTINTSSHQISPKSSNITLALLPKNEKLDHKTFPPKKE